MTKGTFDISSFGLHILAMAFMLGDHLWATVIPGNLWLTCVGRLAFPIFAFCIAEGYRHTRDFKKYRNRLLVFALVSEIPFNLMLGGSWIYPFHQNVLWTFLLALQAMKALDGIREKHRGWQAMVRSALVVTGFYLLGTVLFVDYSGYGVLMVLVFYICQGSGWLPRLGQLALLYLINWHMMRGQQIPVTVLGQALEIPLQGFAVLGLIPIWLYRGRQGPHGKWVRWSFYAFYPAHMLVLGLVSMMR